MGKLIEDEHYVDVVTSGEEAFGRLEAGADYDAVLCDMMMAGMSGMDFTRGYRPCGPPWPNGWSS